MQSLKNWQEEQEMKQLKEDRKRDKQIELEHRRRVLDQIEQDRKERANHFEKIIPSLNNEGSGPSSSSSAIPKANVPRAEPGEFARIQFKKPIGDSEMHMFSSNDKFSVLRSYVEQNVIPGIGIRDYALATTFPRKEFTAADNDQTLSDLGLAPTAVLLILPVSKSSGGSAISSSSSGGTYNFIYAMVMSLLSPVMAAFGYLRNWWATRNNAETGAQKRASEEQVSDHDAYVKRNDE